MNRTDQLWQAYIKGQLTTAELKEFLQLVGEDPARLESYTEQLFAQGQQGLSLPGEEQEILKSLLERINKPGARVVRVRWLRWVAAASIMLTLGVYLWTQYNSRSTSNTATIIPSSHDILPGGQKATLTLADGRVIVLDSAQNGQLAIENGNEIIKRDGQVIYGSPLSPSEAQRRGTSSAEASKAEGFNTMSTPKGGQYKLALPDGSKVWLNAASKIIYPTRFVGKTREVKVEGEVYFEVKANARQPFIVKSGNDEIMVLGTAFNINNYSDEPAAKISLITGAVKVNEKLLQPGQAYTNGKIIQTNIEQDIAWKNGIFNFNNVDLRTAMNQVSRWYDVNIIYENKIPQVQFGGEMGRDLKLNQVLYALDAMGVKFTLQGRNLIVKSIH